MAAISDKALNQLSELYHSYLSWTPEKAEGQRVLVAYTGEITQQRIDNLIKITENAIIDTGSKRKVMKRVCSVLIECLQNTSIHGTRDDDGKTNSFYILLTDSATFKVITGNLILMEEANLLSYKLDELKKLTTAELRKLYIETLCNENFSYKGGAGLGFLTVAKKAEQPIEYSILPIDDTFAFFTTEVVLSR